MFATAFTFGIIIACVTAKIPSYIHICNLKGSNYTQCITESVNNVMDKFCKGFPEYDIPSIMPLTFDKIVIFDTDDIKLHLTDVKIHGYCNMIVNSVHKDPERFSYHINAVLPHYSINSTYNVYLRLLVPISHKGPIEITTDDLITDINLDLKVTTKKGKKYIYASEVNIDDDIKPFKYNFLENSERFAQLHAIFVDVITINEKEMINILESVINEKFGNHIISTFNKIAFSHYEELFPEV